MPSSRGDVPLTNRQRYAPGVPRLEWNAVTDEQRGSVAENLAVLADEMIAAYHAAFQVPDEAHRRATVEAARAVLALCDRACVRNARVDTLVRFLTENADVHPCG